MNFAVNTARNEQCNDFSSDKFSNFQLIRQPVDPLRINECKAEYEKWAINCAVRESIEYFSIFLDKIANAALQIRLSLGLIKTEYLDKKMKSIIYRGAEFKIEELNKIGIEAVDSSYIGYIYKMRNCLSHRAGQVGLTDCNKDNIFILKWIGFDAKLVAESGKEISFNDIIEFPYECKENSKVVVSVVVKEIPFKRGEVICVSPKEASELLFYLMMQSDRYVRSLMDYGDKHGIKTKRCNGPSATNSNGGAAP